jgi:Zn-dependent M28 family amino/carboxypeptidase
MKIAAPVSGRSGSAGAWFAALGFVLALFTACSTTPRSVVAARGVDIQALEREIVSKLAGGIEIRPGIKLTARFTAEDKKEARAFLIEAWRKLGLEVRTQDYSETGQNIYAIAGPADPNAETVVLGAHYDSVRGAPGANDNATGTALITAAAARLSRLKPLTRRLIFVLFDEEERGMRGSRAFAQKLKDEGARIHSVYTVDQMGWDKDGDKAIELEIPYEGALELYARVAAGMKPPIPILTTQERGSDHSAFRRRGFKAVGLTEEYHHDDTTPHIHRAGDTADTVDFDYLASTTELAVRVWALLAQGR